MKKVAAFLLFVIAFNFHSYSQLPYKDAIKLAAYLNAGSGRKTFKNDPASLKEVAKILLPYTTLGDSANTTTILTAFGPNEDDRNPIIHSFLTINLPLAGEKTGKSTIGNLLGGLGNLNVTSFADGLARFLVERSKEELNVAFFRQFKKFLLKYPEVKVVFPSTVKVLSSLQAYNYTAMLPAMRSAFNKDLNGFATQLLDLRDLSSYGDSVNPRIEAVVHFLNENVLGRAACATVLVTNGILQGEHVANVISSLATDRICKDSADNLSNSIFLLDLLSQSLRSSEASPDWISTNEIKAFVDDLQALHLYFGLLYSLDNLHHKIKFNTSGGNFSLQSFLEKVHNKWGQANSSAFVNRFIEVARKGAEVITETKILIAAKQADKEVPIVQYAAYSTAIGQFLEKTIDMLPNSIDIDSSVGNLRRDVEVFATLISTATDCTYDIKTQNYSSLVFHISLILKKLLPDNSQTTDLVTDFLKYGTFAANVVEADNSQEVQAAIEAAVLPIGSSSIKRETEYNISINAYLGVLGGVEIMPSLKENKSGFVTGATAPVGVAFSKGGIGRGDKKDQGGQSFTLFVPLIDVGALATFRLKDDQTKVASEILLKNIISPGLYFYYGFRNCPISVGLGGQLGPELRQVTTQAVDINNNYYFRFGLNVVVDIPLLNLYIKN